MDMLFDQYDFSKTIRDFDYTRRAGRNLQKLYESEDFENCDSEKIFKYLYRQMEMVPFGGYLKRYIYERTGIDEPFREVPDKEYQIIIAESFRETLTPVSMTPTSKKVGAAVKGWLNAGVVRRETVFLLGFGLRMSLGDVSEFLTKVIKEQDFNLLNPQEAIFFHCYWNEKRYLHAKNLLEQYGQITQQDCLDNGYNAEIAMTMVEEVRSRRALLGEEDYLRRYMYALKLLELYAYAGIPKIKVAASKDADYRAHTSADEMQKGAPSDTETEAGRPAVVGNQAASLAAAEFLRMYEKARASAYQILTDSYPEWQKKERSAEDVSPADIEKMLYSGVPVNKSGNMLKSSLSSLGKQFDNYRLNRQRIENILKGKQTVERTDLITMEFFLKATDDSYSDPVIRFEDFRNEMNGILHQCSMYDLYVANPYESFILMCTLTEYPLTSFNDIWEYSYDHNEEYITG